MKIGPPCRNVSSSSVIINLKAKIKIGSDHSQNDFNILFTQNLIILITPLLVPFFIFIFIPYFFYIFLTLFIQILFNFYFEFAINLIRSVYHIIQMNHYY